MAYETHNLIINNSEKLFGEIIIPGDKSITHRAIMLASLAQGRTQIQNYLISEDCMNTIKIMKLLAL